MRNQKTEIRFFPTNFRQFFTIYSVVPEPRFSVDTYFYFLGGMVLASAVAFVLLEHLPSVEQEHAVNYQPFTHNSGIKLSPLYTEETKNNQISVGGVESFSEVARSGS